MPQGITIGGDSVAGVTTTWQPALGITDVHQLHQTVYPTTSTWYHCTFSDTTITGSCQSREDSVYVEVKTCVGIDDITNGRQDYRLIPNLYSDNFTAHITLGEGERGDVLIHGLDGRLMGRHPVMSGVNQLDLSADGLQAGVYLYRVYVNGESKTNGKLVVVH